MNKKEVLEIRRQFSPENCAITRICGCYVDLGVVSMKENGVEAAFLIRSAVDSRKQQVLEEVDAVTKAFGGTGTISSAYQAWQYKPRSFHSL